MLYVRLLVSVYGCGVWYVRVCGRGWHERPLLLPPYGSQGSTLTLLRCSGARDALIGAMAFNTQPYYFHFDRLGLKYLILAY